MVKTPILKKMDYHGSSLHLQAPKFENHFILPNFIKNKFLIKDVTSITTPTEWTTMNLLIVLSTLFVSVYRGQFVCNGL